MGTRAAGVVTADGFDICDLSSIQRRADKAAGARRVHGIARALGAASYRPGSRRNRTVEATCWMLLKRYGIVFRDVLARDQPTQVA